MYTVKKLPNLLRYIPDWYKTQKMCDEAILENCGTLKSVPDCYRNLKMCNESVYNCPYASEFVTEC